MKKILFFMACSLFLLAPAHAQNSTDLAKSMNSSSMPSDEEIMQTIKKFNFDKAQEEYLFKETKRQLEEMYKTNDFSKLEQNQNAAGGRQTQSKNTNSSQRQKKYSKHAPLTRRSK